MNIVEQRFVLKKDDALKEKMFLAKNLAQDYFAKLDYHNRYPDEKTISGEEEYTIIEKYGKEFEKWYESEEGRKNLLKYVEKHTEAEIVEKKDIDKLVQSFFVFRNRKTL